MSSYQLGIVRRNITRADPAAVKQLSAFGVATESFAVSIVWGDGTTSPATITGTSFTATHLFADDHPFTGTPSVSMYAGGSGVRPNARRVAAAQNVAKPSDHESRMSWKSSPMKCVPPGLSSFDQLWVMKWPCSWPITVSS